MKVKLICAAVVGTLAAAAVGGTVIKGAAIETTEDLGVSETDLEAVEIDNSADLSQEISVLEESFPVKEDSADVLDVSSEAVDPVDDRITYTLDIRPDTISLKMKVGFEYTGECEDSTISLNYLEDFFGNDNFPVDEKYKENLVRYTFNGSYTCGVADDTVACSPVDGKVIAVGRSASLGLAVAVEFDSDKIFILTNFDEVNVEVGDNVCANQVIGVCGTSGMVPVGEPQLGLIIINKK